MINELKNFLIESDKLSKLKPYFKEAAIEIKKAIDEERPIIVKHHDDCDGYCGAVALERALLPLIKRIHSNKRSEYTYFKRYPSMSPYYDYFDATKDSAHFLTDIQYGKKTPLIILIDLGDIPQNVVSIQKLKIYGTKFIVIDHHNPKKDTNIMVEAADVFVNPYITGADSNLVSGMLCTEIARIINPSVQSIKFLPALAGIADKSTGEELEKYLKICDYDKEFLKKYAIAIEFEAHYLRYSENRHFVDDLFGADIKKQKQLIEQAYDIASKKFIQTKLAVKHYVKMKKVGITKVITIDSEKVSKRGEFPSAGKTVRIAHELSDGKRITMGILSDSVIFRVHDVDSFDVNELLEKIQKDLPHSLVDGGGHKFAGSLKFIEASKFEVLKYIERYIRMIK